MQRTVLYKSPSSKWWKPMSGLFRNNFIMQPNTLQPHMQKEINIYYSVCINVERLLNVEICAHGFLNLLKPWRSEKCTLYLFNPILSSYLDMTYGQSNYLFAQQLPTFSYKSTRTQSKRVYNVHKIFLSAKLPQFNYVFNQYVFRVRSTESKNLQRTSERLLKLWTQSPVLK